MPQLLTLTRAARLVGSTRGALQRKIKLGELETFEGMVRAEDLLRAYPEARLEDNTVIERMAQIKDSAFSKRIRERLLPDAEILVARLSALGKELADTKTQLQQYRGLIERFQNTLGAAEQEADGDARRAVGALKSWLQRELQPAALGVDRQAFLVKDSFLRLMTAHVQILPSQHEFFVEGSDSLLEAALRAGLALDYGCSNGNCGLCKARLVSGQVKKIRPHDYVLSEADKNAGCILMCSNTAVNDLIVEAREAGGAQDIPLQRIAARVKRVEPLGNEILLLHLQTPRTNRLRFLAGQQVSLGLPDNSLVAEYPVASCPCDDRNLEFHIPRLPGNAFSDYVSKALKPTDVVTVEGPKGTFVFDDESHRPAIFIACDTGFAPIKSLIEHAMALDVAESMQLYWIATDGRHYLHNLARSWADALDSFGYTPLAGGMNDALARISTDHPWLGEFDVYLAGPEPAVDEIEAALLAHGLPRQQLFSGRTP
ncbi:MAG: 2Fe-2S iron-sulfur cluster binding domain-containing protein [Gammaproteobacteria bacterium]|nr:2Fe-2S iron-sulfur cluster binding domain-containing protein [Gammaproteobacteria bacterium]